MKYTTTFYIIIILVASTLSCSEAIEPLVIDSQDQWLHFTASSEGICLSDGAAQVLSMKSYLRSRKYSFEQKKSIHSIRFNQTPSWLHWTPLTDIKPTNLKDAPVFAVRGNKDYWLFGRYQKINHSGFIPKKVILEGYSDELITTPDPRQFNAPGGLRPSLGGYHAWKSRDMKTWVHYGPVSEFFSRWVTSAEFVDGILYLYYDYPNDQDPHLYIDTDLTDGVPGSNMGLAFKTPCNGSDSLILRDRGGVFHIIYEDWSTIDPSSHHWDAPIAGHATGFRGYADFTVREPMIDLRTNPTGNFGSYLHPHWLEHPQWTSNIGIFQEHSPEQDAFGDWAGIVIENRLYLFGDYLPAGSESIHLAWFTSSSISPPLVFCGELPSEHPDPDIGFAENRFYLFTQQPITYSSTGPWVGSVAVRILMDTDNDGIMDKTSTWKPVSESYSKAQNYAKIIDKTAAVAQFPEMDSGYSFIVEIMTSNDESDPVFPSIDSLIITF
jgi:hypothetical protein